MKVVAAALASLALTAASAGALEIVDATSPQKLLPAFAKFGAAEVTADDSGDPLIKGSIDGITYLVFFYGCTDHAGCKNLTFTASWDFDGVDADAVNTWNRTMRFGKAFLDEEGDPAIQMSVNLDYGVTVENFADTVDWWRVVLNQFRDQVITN
jgi:hypothetical protein